MTNTQPKSNQERAIVLRPWREIVLVALTGFAGQQVTTASLYGAVCAHRDAKKRLSLTKNARAKVRQVVNGLADDEVVKRIGKGLYEVPADLGTRP